MATKIYCAAIDCEHRKEDGRCAAKEVFLSDHSIMTVWEGRMRFQRCKAWQKSREYSAMEERLSPLLEKLNNGHTDNH